MSLTRLFPSSATTITAQCEQWTTSPPTSHAGLTALRVLSAHREKESAFGMSTMNDVVTADLHDNPKIGINHSAHPNPSINRDVYEIAHFLHGTTAFLILCRAFLMYTLPGFGFEQDSTRVLTDDQPLNLHRPTKKSIVSSISKSSRLSLG